MLAYDTEQRTMEWAPDTPEKVRTARHQMGRILSSSHFRNSKRYPLLFQYLVEAALERRTEILKERTLGVAVFKRSPDYDTNSDPVVRITAGEIRKRIAQYYHEPGHEDELRIDIPSGSYVPRFTLHSTASAAAGDAVTPVASESIDPRVKGEASQKEAKSGNPVPQAKLLTASSSWRLRYTAPVFTAVTVMCILVWIWYQRQSALDSVWGPVLAGGTPALVAIGEPKGETIPLDQPLTVGQHIRNGDHVTFADVQALVRITGIIGDHKNPYRLQAAKSTTFEDLRQGPTILLGGYNNQWTLRALNSTRYTLVRPSPEIAAIMDHKNASNLQWTVYDRQPYDQLSYDYAIVARFLDSSTNKPVLIVAGIGENGSKAAGEFVTDAKDLAMLVGANPSLKNRNFEVVLGTQVVKGVSGPPRILATEVW